MVETEHIAECGHRKRVRFPVRSLMDYFKQDVATQLAAALSRMRELSHEKLPEHEYFSQFAKLQIELYLDEQLVASQYLMNSAQNTNAAGNLECTRLKALHCITLQAHRFADTLNGSDERRPALAE